MILNDIFTLILAYLIYIFLLNLLFERTAKFISIGVALVFFLLQAFFMFIKALASPFNENTCQHNALIKTAIGIYNYKITSCCKS
jgi:dolichyl-phosphate-mannose--protein O-mannosyl transferase